MKTFEVFQVDSGAIIQSYDCDYFRVVVEGYQFWKRADRWFHLDTLVGTFPGHYRNVAVREKRKEEK